MRIPAGTMLGIAFALAVGWIGAGCGADNSANPAGTPAVSPTAVQTATPTTSVTPAASFEKEVEAAYLAYWDAYSAGVLNLDEGGLGEAMTGPILVRTQGEIADLRQRGRAARIDVEHRFFVAELNEQAGTATVVDEYTNRSYLVDPETKQPIGSIPPGSRVTDTYFLIRMDERWKVRDGIRSTGS